MIDDYLKRRGWRESASGRDYLAALRDSTPSLYEVVDVDPGHSLKVRDLLVPGEEVTIQEKKGSQGAAPWDRLAARIVVVDKRRLFTGAVLVFNNDATNNVLAAFDYMVKVATRASGKGFPRMPGARGRRRGRAGAVPSALREELIRSMPCAQILTHFWLTDALSRAMAPPPKLQNTDGDEMVFCEVRFPITGDKSRVSALLDGIKGFRRESDSALQWTWFAPGSPSHRRARLRRKAPVTISAKETFTTTLGHAEIEAGMLTLSVNSRERADRGQELLSSRLGELVGPALVSSQDAQQALKANEAEPTQRGIEPLTAEHIHAMHSYLDEHYRRTLEEPIPELAGKTLRQAAANKKSRKQAIDWLKQMENTEHRRAAAQGHKVYDTRWIWQELGIERPR